MATDIREHEWKSTMTAKELAAVKTAVERSAVLSRQSERLVRHETERERTHESVTVPEIIQLWVNLGDRGEGGGGTSVIMLASSAASRPWQTSAPSRSSSSSWSGGSSQSSFMPTVSFVPMSISNFGAFSSAASYNVGSASNFPSSLARFNTGGVAAGAVRQFQNIARTATGIFQGPGGEREDRIMTVVPAGTGIVNAKAARFYGGQGFLNQLGRKVGTVPVPQALVPILVSDGEGWLAPEVVAAHGGAPFLWALNNLALPKFESGGIAHSFDPSRIQIDRREPGIFPSRSAVVSQALQNGQGGDAKSPEVRVIVANSREAMLQALQSRDAKKFILDLVTGHSTELGIRS